MFGSKEDTGFRALSYGRQNELFVQNKVKNFSGYVKSMCSLGDTISMLVHMLWFDELQ